MNQLSAKRKRNTRLILKIAGITLVSFAIIWGTDIINQNLKAEGSDSQEVIDITSYTGTIEGINGAFQMMDSSKNITGYKVDISKQGYGGDIRLEVVINGEGNQLNSIHVLEQNETEGLGSKITQEEFLNLFQDIEIPVYLNGVPNEEQSAELEGGTGVDAISGATVSSKAVVQGINEASEFVNDFILK